MPRAATNGHSPKDQYDLIAEMIEAARQYVPRERGEELFRKWLPRRDKDVEGLSEKRMFAMTADAILLAGDLLLSQPSGSGSTGFDRLAKNRAGAGAAEAAALSALRRSRFRLLQVEGPAKPHGVMARDVITGDVLLVEVPELPPLGDAIHLFARVVDVGGAKNCLAGAITPLDLAAYAVARSHPSAGATNPAASSRWAEALYAHVVRHGTYEVPGLNRPADYGDKDDFEPGQDELGELAMAWLDLAGGPPDADLLATTRQVADLPTILDALAAAVLARDAGRADMGDAFERLLEVQLETVHRRQATGARALTLDDIARGLDDAMRRLAWPLRVKTLFETLRARVTGARRADDPGLERLMQRIQALRAKTVAHGCTEQEALAAAEKVAELLDRHGLSLNELEFKAQPCEGIGIQTNRRRAAPIDECIPCIAAFFDCRVWQERTEDAPFRYIFFGLRGDVSAAQYLYELVERAFETETDNFRASEIYLGMAGERRTATNSFQTGLARGIAEKLHASRAARDAVMRSASGRDLVPMKAAMVDEEMEKLGLSLTSRVLSRGKRVLSDAYEAGQAAGERFQYTPAITKAA